MLELEQPQLNQLSAWNLQTCGETHRMPVFTEHQEKITDNLPHLEVVEEVEVEAVEVEAVEMEVVEAEEEGETPLQ